MRPPIVYIRFKYIKTARSPSNIIYKAPLKASINAEMHNKAKISTVQTRQKYTGCASHQARIGASYTEG